MGPLLESEEGTLETRRNAGVAQAEREALLCLVVQDAANKK
jgi:hypothetical protein